LLAAVLAICQEAMDKPHSEKEDLYYLKNVLKLIEEEDNKPNDEEEIKS
jgi:hypothetical protein